MIGQLLVLNALVLVTYMSVWYGVARLRRRLDTVDIAWGLGFVLIAWVSALKFPSNRSLIIASLVTIWGVRLAMHIGQRARRTGEDPRYKVMSAAWKGNIWLRAYFSVFLLQGALIWIVGLPIMTITGRPYEGLGWLSVVGTVIWLLGFIIEAIADRQLANFLQQAERAKVLQTGLWRYSRHPNYFGELLQWWAIGTISLQVSWGWIGLLGPLVLTFLIVFISGIPPIEKRRARDPAYRAYQQRTSALIPWLPKQGRA